MHDTIAVGIPVLVILFGILLNQRGLDRVDGRLDKVDSCIDRMQTELTARIDRMQTSLSQFYRILGEHAAKIDIIMEDRRKQ